MYKTKDQIVGMSVVRGMVPVLTFAVKMECAAKKVGLGVGVMEK